MRPDEGGCADLRRSLTAHTKLVRSPTYAPARRPRPRAGVRGARGCARGVSVAVAPEGRHPIGPSMRSSMGATLPGVPSACGTAPQSARPHHRGAVAGPADLGRNRLVGVAATRCHRRGSRSGHPSQRSGRGYREYRTARRTLPGSEVSPLGGGSGKPAAATTGRHGEPGVSWHTGEVRAHCTGAMEPGTAATLVDWGAFL